MFVIRSRYARKMGHFDVVNYGLISFDERDGSRLMRVISAHEEERVFFISVFVGEG